MSVETELGLLVVVVLKARNLIDKHSFYKQDAFAQISLSRTELQTPVVIKGGQHPVWDAELRVPVMRNPTDKNRTLFVSCWSKEHKKNDLLGEGKVDISETLKTKEFDDWVPLTINGVQRGDVYLEMTFFPNTSSKSPNQRPSELDPSDRLQRPASNTPPKVSPSSSPSHSPGRSRPQPDTSSPPSQLRPTFTPSPTSSRVSSATSSRQHSPLPPLPSDRIPIPPTLIPGVRANQTPSPRSTSSSSNHRDYFPAPMPKEPSVTSSSVPQSLNPGRRDPPSSLHPAHTFPPQSFHQAPPVPPQYVAQPAFVSNPTAVTYPGVQPSPGSYRLPGAWPDASKSSDNSIISFPVPQRTSPSTYNYSFANNPQVVIPSAPLPYPGAREPPLPDPYARPVYAAPPPPPPLPPSVRGRQPLNP